MFIKFAHKIIDILPTLLGVSLLAFFLIRLVPGDPVMLMLGERGSDPETYQQMQKALGLDRPLLLQYFEFIKGALQGELGHSIISKGKVVDEFFDRFPATLELGLVALTWAMIIGIPIGVLAAVKRNTFLDYFFMTSSLIGYSMPIFWWGLILILVFSVQLGLTPVSGRISVIYDVDPWSGFYLIDTLTPSVLRAEGLNAFKSALSHIILPSVAMGTIPMAVIARITRSSLLDVLGEDFIRTAKAKGLSHFKVVIHHALRNALIPIVTIIGLLFGSIITGAILTESIFSWPGIGKWFVASINARDYPVIQGGILFIASSIVLINTAVDVLYRLINPKLRKP